MRVHRGHARYFFFRSGSASGFPGPKCFRMTSGSVALVFLRILVDVSAEPVTVVVEMVVLCSDRDRAEAE